MKELDLAKLLANDAGKIILEYFNNILSVSKGDGSPITLADTHINSMVIKEILLHFPQDSIIGEEEVHLSPETSRTWVCDPIDGTLPYALGIPTCVFSLALLNYDGHPILAVVYDPFLRKMHWAVKNQGAFLNGKRLTVNRTNTIEDALIGNSGRSSSFVDAPHFKTYVYLECYRPVILHSVIYEAMLVASGKIAATILTSAGEHDAVSAKLIVEEAGGAVTDLFGNDQRYDKPITGAIISNGLIHEEIVNIAKIYKIA